MPLRKKEEAKQKFDSFGKNFTLEEARTNVYILIDEIYEAKDQEITELKVPDRRGEDSEVTLDGGMVYFINVPENEKYKVVILADRHGS